MAKSDQVNEPSHYQRVKESLGVECIEVIGALEHLNGNYTLGNAFKYLWRAGAKDAMNQDLNKSLWYMARYMLENDPDSLRSTLLYFHGLLPSEEAENSIAINGNTAFWAVPPGGAGSV